MNTIGRFKINESTKLYGHGLIVVGENVEGAIKAGDWVTFNTGEEDVSFKVAGVEQIITVSGVRYTIFMLVYKDQEEQKRYESIRLKPQIIEIKNSLHE